MVSEIARAKRLDVTQTMLLRQSLRHDLDNHEAWFDHYRTLFLMLDLVPQNKARFGLAYSDCMPRA